MLDEDQIEWGWGGGRRHFNSCQPNAHMASSYSFHLPYTRAGSARPIGREEKAAARHLSLVVSYLLGKQKDRALIFNTPNTTSSVGAELGDPHTHQAVILSQWNRRVLSIFFFPLVWEPRVINIELCRAKN